MRENVEKIEYELEWDPEGIGCEGQSLNHCCGVTEVGGFNELDAHLENMRDQHDSFVAEHSDWDSEKDVLVPHPVLNLNRARSALSGSSPRPL
jgi:hypothetical protein